MPRGRKPLPIDPNATSKVCTGCRVEKSLDDFHAHKFGRYGKRSRCKKCQNEANRPWMNANTERVNASARRWRAANPEKLEKSQTKYLETPEGRGKMLWHAARQRRPEGFALTKEHVIRGIRHGICPITGFRFDLSARYRRTSDKSRSPYAPSLDRIDGKGGYTDDNVRVVCSQVNIMRGELSDAEMLAFCRAALDYTERKAA